MELPGAFDAGLSCFNLRYRKDIPVAAGAASAVRNTKTVRS